MWKKNSQPTTTHRWIFAVPASKLHKFIYVMYQARETVFYYFGNTEKRDQKLRVAECFEELRGIWKCGETLSRLVSISSWSIKTTEKRSDKIVKLTKIRYPNTVLVMISFLWAWWVRMNFVTQILLSPKWSRIDFSFRLQKNFLMHVSSSI